MHKMFTVLLVLILGLGTAFPAKSTAQEGPPDVAEPGLAQPGITQAELEGLVAAGQAGGGVGNTPTDGSANGRAGASSGLAGMNFLQLLIDGGALMIPIGVMSLVVLAVGAERWISLRSGRIFPRRLRREIRRVADDQQQFSPAELYRAAELFPSSASRVLKELLAKVGRPIPEAESTMAESLQHEADRLYGNVRWLTLAAAVTPLLGLLGTVWGMIIAFYNTTQLASGANRVESLAEGIYVALVTTLAGLAVAIPAAILAHYFEGKITKCLGLIEFELRHLMPRFEQFEGRVRFDIGPRGISSRPVLAGTAATSTSTPPGSTHAADRSTATGGTGSDGSASHAIVRPPKLKT